MLARVYYSTVLRRAGRTAPTYDESQRDLRDTLRRTLHTALPR